MTPHERTLRLLGIKANSNGNMERIKKTESRLGVNLPSVFKEWYSLSESDEILRKYSNDDQPIPCEQFKLSMHDGKQLVPFKIENQSVCTWAIDINSGQDPDVLVAVDCDEKLWVYVQSFSNYVYSCVWDYAICMGNSIVVMSNNIKFSAESKAALESMFEPEITTHGWPGDNQFRYSGQGVQILVWDSKDQADWFISSENEIAIIAALRKINDLDGVGATLYGNTGIAVGTIKKFHEMSQK